MRTSIINFKQITERVVGEGLCEKCRPAALYVVWRGHCVVGHSISHMASELKTTPRLDAPVEPAQTSHSVSTVAFAAGFE